MPEPEVLFKPNPGPQSIFLSATEEEVFYGGAAGGGKSEAVLWGALRYIDKPHYRALILRKTFPELQELMDRSMQYKKLGGKWNEQKKRWTFPSGATVEFGYFEQWKHHTRYQGQEYQYIAWDELGACPEERFWTFLASRCRSKDPEIPAVMRGTGNPGGAGHAWVKRRFIDKCGVNGETIYVDPDTGLRRRFIPAKLKDNPVLEQNDPTYRKRLQSLPEVMMLQLLEGDWGASSGMALPELNREKHIVEPYQLESDTFFFGAFDWGYSHPASFGIFVALPGKRVELIDSLSMWQKTPLEQIERVKVKLDELKLNSLQYIAAGHDCWADVKARGENVPTIAELWAESGLPLMKANISRVAGLNNLRQYITLIGEGGQPKEPYFRIWDTVNNQQVYETLETMVLDPNDLEDTLKIDADEYGSGGDDAYDMVRYGLASRPLNPKATPERKTRNRNFDHKAEEFIKKHPYQRRRARRRRR